jgi:hypothetical protein
MSLHVVQVRHAMTEQIDELSDNYSALEACPY